MCELKDTILIWYGAKQVRLSRKYVIEHLVKENARKHGQNTLYLLGKGNYDDILREMDNINTIQIYEDDAIRLHLKHEHYEQPKSIIFSAQEEMAEVLKEFVK